MRTGVRMSFLRRVFSVAQTMCDASDPRPGQAQEMMKPVFALKRKGEKAKLTTDIVDEVLGYSFWKVIAIRMMVC